LAIHAFASSARIAAIGVEQRAVEVDEDGFDGHMETSFNAEIAEAQRTQRGTECFDILRALCAFASSASKALGHSCFRQFRAHRSDRCRAAYRRGR
jgi:hypothetical protein